MKLYLILFLIQFTCTQTEASTATNLAGYFNHLKKSDPAYEQIQADRESITYIIDQGMPTPRTTLRIRNEKGINSETNQDTTVLTGSVNKEIVETGTALSATHTQTTRPDREEDVTQLRLEQSLYKNMFGRDVRLRKENLTLREQLRTFEVLENYESYLVQGLNRYLTLNKIYNDYKLAEKLYKEALNLHKNVQAKRRSNIASVTDVKRSELLLLLRQEEQALLKSQYETARQEIETVLKTKMHEFESNESQQLVELLEKQKMAVKESAVDSFRAYQIASLRKVMADQEVTLIKREFGPEVNLIAGYNKDDSTRFATSIKRTETVIGIQLEIPLGDDQAKAQTQLAKVDSLRAQIHERQTKLAFEQQLTALTLRLDQQKEQLKIDGRKVELMESIVDDDEKRFSIGRLELERLIELKNNYATYRKQYEQSKLSYLQSLIEWLALNDKLIEIIDVQGQA